jgi:starch synthase
MTARLPAILFATSEVAPLMKTGGLADVSAALPKALAGHGCPTRILLPGYGDLLARLPGARVVHRGEVAGQWFELLEATFENLPTLWVVRCPRLFDRPGNPYLGPDGHDWPDNAERFAFFGRVIADVALREVAGHRPDIVHLNDWQTGIGGALLASAAERPCIVFTIHNLNFQGRFDYDWLSRLGLPATLGTLEALEFHGGIAFIKGGLVFADAITTVSPGYAREIQTPALGAGLDGLLRHRAADLSGILNGIDTEVWNPATDPLIAARYDTSTLDRKADNKRAVQAAMQLPVTRAPLLGMVTRLTEQKGIDLVLAALPQLRELGVQLAILGSGSAHFEQALAAAAAVHPAQVAFRNGYDESLAHLIEAGADLFLMPSRFEPCGLNQMYSMAYGTPPIVHRTGGLGDTVRHVVAGSPDSAAGAAATRAPAPVDGTGFVFDHARPEDLVVAVREALDCWRDPARWRAVQMNGMRQDFSWTASSRAYLDLYEALRTRRASGRADVHGR